MIEGGERKKRTRNTSQVEQEGGWERRLEGGLLQMT
jgi:hypothetical protein